MKKIAILCISGSWGGLEINAAKIGRWLQERGNKVIFLTPKESKAFQYLENDNVASIPFSASFKYANLLAARRLKKILKQEECSNLLITLSKDINLGIITKLLSQNIKVAYLQQMDIGISKKDIFHTFFYKRLNHWISPLPSITKRTLEYTRFDPKKIVEIPLCIRLDKFVKVQGQQELARQKLNISPSYPLIGIIGRLDPGKGQEFLIRAAHILKQKGIPIEVLFVGDESVNDTRQYPIFLKELITELDVKAHFRPFMDEVEWAFAALDIFVMASVGETFGMVTVEAMASGVPVLGAKVGGTVDLIEADTGRFFQTEDPNALANALEKMLLDPAQLAKLSEQALKVVQQKYSHEVMCESIEKLFS